MTTPTLVKVYAAAALFAFACTAAAVPPDYLLTIDVSNPAAVVISATGNVPLVNTTGQTAFDGIELTGFFTEDQSGMLVALQLPNTTLTGVGLTMSYDDAWRDDLSNPGTDTDLNLFVDGNDPGFSDPENFSTSLPAFTGSWTLDLSAQGLTPDAFPALGTSGDIAPGYSGNSSAVIGQWEVVATPTPEPGTMGLFTMGAMVLTAAMFRKNAAIK